MPGSGKSHWCAKNAGGALLLTADRMRTGHVRASALFGSLYRSAAVALLEGRDVMIDACSLQWRDRRPWLAIAARHEARTRLVIIDTPLRVCHARDSRRVRSVGRSSVFYARFCETLRVVESEGWDVVRVIDGLDPDV